MSFVKVPGGTMTLAGGVSVTLDEYSIAITEVTQGQWTRVMGSNPSDMDRGIGQDYPVNRVSWYDALVFVYRLSMIEGLTPVYSIAGSSDPTLWGLVPEDRDPRWDAVVWNPKANGYRLPTEAEWEYAARGGAQSPTYDTTYAGSNDANEVAWYNLNSSSGTQPVASKSPNHLGIFDMSGNVWEWSWNCRGGWQTGGTNPIGPDSGEYRVLRGGSWSGNANSLGLSFFFTGEVPHYRSSSGGLRLARSEPALVVQGQGFRIENMNPGITGFGLLIFDLETYSKDFLLV